MKLVIFLLIIASLHVTARGISQTVTYAVKDAPLRDVLKELERQTQFSFFYDKSLLKNSKLVTLDVHDQPLATVLDMLFTDEPITYSIKRQAVVLSATVDQKPSVSNLPPADAPIAGTVRDTAGNALSGATVYNKRTKKSVQTNAKGQFIIEGEIGDELQLSYIGYENLRLKINQNNFLAVMRVSNSPLDEIQIMAYGETSRRLSTGNITTVKAEEIARQPVDNPLLALQGRVPGLIITPTSGVPGAPVKLQIRGQNSLTGKSSEPLIVIDGVPFANNVAGANAFNSDPNLSALRFINPYDIASIDVLKDADATAIYGSRGANGVILITTKKGKISSARISLNAFSGFNQRSNKKLKLLNTQQYLEMRKEAYLNDGLPIPTNPDPNNYDLTVWDQNRYTDWQEVFGGDKGSFTSVQTSLSGGTSAIQYLISGTYNGQTSIFPGHAKDESGVGHFNLAGTSSNQKLKASLTGSYTGNRSTTPDFTAPSIYLSPNAPEFFTENGELNWEPNPLTGFATWENPYAKLFNVVSSNTNTITSSIDISYQLTPGLQVKANAGFSKMQLTSYSPWTIASQDPATYGFARASATHNHNSSNSWNIEPQLSYETQISEGKLDVLVGGTLQSQNQKRHQVTGAGYTSDALLKNLSSAPMYFANNGSSAYKYAGVFSRISYRWQGKYVLNLNARRDGSSRFGPGNQYGNFGSVGLAWIFTNEGFASRALPFMSFGKLRFSYGNTGHDNIGDFQFIEIFSNIDGTSGTYQGIRTIRTDGAINANFHWESTRKMEFGLDAGFLKDRIVVSAAYFRNRSSDQLGSFSLPATGGNANITMNQPAKIQNSGAEFTLTTTNVRAGAFNWSTSVNVGLTRNKLIDIPDDFTGYNNVYLPESPVGKPFSAVMRVYDVMGMDPATGHFLFADIDGNPTSDIYAKFPAKVISTNPEFAGGISNNFSYKGLSLDVFLQFTKQTGRNYMYSDPFIFAGLFQAGTANLPLEIYEQRWRKPGDVTAVQRLSQSGDFYERWMGVYNSELAWTDASFIRIKNVSLSYGVSDRVKQKLRLQNLRIYVQAQNLFTFSKYIGDPETQNMAVLAPMRVVTAGIQIEL